MKTDGTKATILHFARYIGRTDVRTPTLIARRRGWLDSRGEVTQDGKALADALGEQTATRTVFRGNF
ncbi:MAG: hypothetical protein AAGM84_00750 [Pseudomonadota bacterium]